MSNYAWVTLTTNDTYSLGALVLAHSLKRAGTAYQLVVLVTPGVSECMRQRLKEVYDIVQEVNVMDSQDAANLALLARPELGITFTKLHCWRLVQFEKCVFLDSDALVLKNCDELFEREELSAAPDVSWPDCFNSGVFVYQPSLETFDKLTKFAVEYGSFDGGDQGLLNQYFGDWAYVDIHKHLPFVYNVTAYASYCYLPAFKHFKDKIKILHFAGKMKPWLMHYNAQNKTPNVPSQYTHAADLIQLWWNIFFDNVHQRLNRSMRYYSALLKQWKNNYDPPKQTQQHQHQHQQQQQQLGFCSNLKAKDFNLKYNQSCSLIAGYNERLNDDTQANQTSSKQVNNEERKTNESVYRDACLVECCNVWQRGGRGEKESQQQIPEPEGTNVQIQNIKRKDNQEQQQQCDNCVHQQKKAQMSLINALELEAEGKAIAATIKTNDFNSNLLEILTNINEFYLKEDTNKYATDNLLNSAEEQISHSFHENLENFETNANDAKIRMMHDCDRDKNESTEAGLAGALSQLRLGEQRTDEQEAYDLLMRRQAWEAGQMDYTGLDSFDNIWKKIQETLQSKPEDGIAMLTSADIQDGKIEYDAKTGATTKYKKIDGGYEMITTTPQPNGTVKTQVRTFWDPKPVSEEDMKREQANRKVVQQRMNKEIRIDERTTMLTRAIEGGYEEVYTTVNEDGTVSTKTKTFFDSVPAGTPFPGQDQYQPQSQQPQQLGKKTTVKRNTSVDSTDSTETRNLVQNVNKNQQIQHNIQQENVHHNVQQKVQQNVKQNVQQTKIQHQSTIEESHRFTENIEITENSRTVRKNSLQEQSTKSITTSNMSDSNKDTKKKVKKQKSSAPPPPPDFLQNDTTTVSSKRVPGGTEYTYTTQLESGKKITTSKTVYEEEETELTEEEIKQYKKALKDAEKHKNVTTTKKLKSDSGTKKVVPSENPGDVTTVETIKIDGGTEYHYTTVTAEGIVKKAVKTVYDPVACNDPDDTEEEEIVEEYEEEIIEPGEKSIQTIETIKKLPQKFEEEVTITHEKKEKKIKKSMMVSQ